MTKLSFTQRIPFFVRLFNWEYWPFNIVYIPVGVYYVWLAIKARSLFFFAASNPAIETGGMFGESKWKIFKLLPADSYPPTLLINGETDAGNILRLINDNSLSYPLIAKPDRGERGWMVSKIHSEAELCSYAAKMKSDFLIQAYVDMPVELSIFYYRYPGSEKGIVSSIVVKEMLQVTGNGKSTLLELITRYPRALLQLDVLKKAWGNKLNEVPPDGEKIILVPIGNHSRGAKFIDACHLIDAELTGFIDSLSKKIPGFFFGRFDLRCQSIESLKAGKNYQILELNGAGAEPAHIYHPGYSLWQAYKVLFHHFHVLYQISIINHRAGAPYMNLKEYLAMQKLLKAYRQKATAE